MSDLTWIVWLIPAFPLLGFLINALFIRRERPAVRDAVVTRIAKYSCEVATRATVDAVSVLTQAGLAPTAGASGVVHTRQ